jgi:G3E family GTPase
VSARASYVMVGGFLGAGKTTAVARLARHLTERGLRVGLITNDQSTGLVDTTLLRTTGLPVEEIGGGCFCCRFHTLEDAVGKLTERTRPDVFLAEPVGSCTDLVATVSYPLRRIYGERYRIAPLSVLVDPRRAARLLGLIDGPRFSDKVAYVYEKQLEEAALILVNKIDRLDAVLRGRLEAELARRYPRAEILSVSALEGGGMDAWYARILGENEHAGPTLDIDYGRYAEGEALLGWCNATVAVRSAALIDANRLVSELAEAMRAAVGRAGGEVAHLKLTLESPDAGGALAALSVVASDAQVDVRETLLDRVSGGSLVVNVRAEVAPEVLSDALRAALAALEKDGLALAIEHEEHFRPAPPVPVHRDEHLQGVP